MKGLYDKIITIPKGYITYTMNIPDLISKYFITCNSRNGKYTVELETNTLAEAQELYRTLLGIKPWKETLDIEPWKQANEQGELPGDICCQRAVSKYCFEHDKNNY